jgi:hypothetical protein
MIYEGKTRKIGYPKIEGEKVHLPMIEKRRRSRGFAPPLGRPGYDSAVLLR